ncbi:MAG: thiopurine S-methyltransferase [Sinobacteraceae bacterium]|nr:thiopurine S-methyltransferase [Nevskiaceae bacterium]
MEPQFWHDRWERREIGFHMAKPHVALARHWHSLALTPGARVFVPLAGKSLDLIWLAEHSHRVVGIELSQLAVREFAEEHPEARGVDLRCGDLFELTPATLGRIDAIFDRASLVALPPSMRIDYATQLARLSPPGTQTLLVTMEYDQRQMRGPPHAVMPDEVHALFGATHDITVLEELTALEDFPRMSARGVTHLSERIYRLRRR